MTLRLTGVFWILLVSVTSTKGNEIESSSEDVDWNASDLKCNRPGLTRYRCITNCDAVDLSETCTVNTAVQRCTCDGLSTHFVNSAIYNMKTGEKLSMEGFSVFDQFCKSCVSHCKDTDSGNDRSGRWRRKKASCNKSESDIALNKHQGNRAFHESDKSKEFKSEIEIGKSAAKGDKKLPEKIKSNGKYSKERAIGRKWKEYDIVSEKLRKKRSTDRFDEHSRGGNSNETVFEIHSYTLNVYSDENESNDRSKSIQSTYENEDTELDSEELVDHNETNEDKDTKESNKTRVQLLRRKTGHRSGLIGNFVSATETSTLSDLANYKTTTTQPIQSSVADYQGLSTGEKLEAIWEKETGFHEPLIDSQGFCSPPGNESRICTESCALDGLSCTMKVELTKCTCDSKRIVATEIEKFDMSLDQAIFLAAPNSHKYGQGYVRECGTCIEYCARWPGHNRKSEVGNDNSQLPDSKK